MLLHLIGFLIFGFVIGVIARLLTPGKQHMTLLATTLLGMAGAVLAGWIGRVVGWYGPDDSAGFITATIGAIVLLVAYDAFQRRKQARLGGSPLSMDKKKPEFPSKAA